MAEQKIHLGKFINNLDSEDLSSEKLQGVVNNVYAKAVSTHKKKAKEVEERTKEQEEDTVTFVKSNHDRLKAHKNKPEKDINKDDAKEVEPKGKTAKGVDETKGSAVVESKQVKESFSVVDLGDGTHFGNYSSIDQAKGKALQYYSLRLNDGKLAIVDGSMNPVGIVNRDGTISKEARQVKEARADAPEYHDVSDEEIAMELADRYYNHEIDLPRLHSSLKRLFGSTKKAVEWFADYDLARRTVRKRAGKPVEESKGLNAKTPFRKRIAEDSDKSFPSKKDYIDAFMGIYGCTKAWAEKQWKMAQAENDVKFANTVVDLWKRNKQVNESHDCKRNYRNVRFASQEIEKKGYSHEEANDIALKLFDDIEGDTQRSLEWHLEKILPKEDFDRENQKLTEADDSDNLVVKGVTVTGVKDKNTTSVVVPEGIRYIGKAAFYKCTKLKEIKLPETLEGIESDAFAYCTSLEQLEIPKKVQYINTGAFAQCPSLKVLKLPAKFTKGDLGSRGIGFNTNPKIVAESKNLSSKNIVETSIPRNATKIKVGGREFTKEKDWVDGNRVHVSPKDIKRLYGNDVEVLETDPNYKSKRTKEVKVLQGNYGYGWDDLVEYEKEDSAELKQDLRSYRENERNAQFRVVTRRVPLGEDKLTEAEDGNMTIETSTSILDMFYPSLYQTIDDYYIPDNEWGRVDDILANTSMEFAERAIRKVFPRATLKFKELRHPREYNYGGENIIFDVTLPRADYESVKEDIILDPGFEGFLKKNSPRSGYIPFGAYTIDKFKSQDDMYSIGQIVKFMADDEDMPYDFDEEFREEISNNFETYDYLWEEVMDWLREHDQAYQDFKDHFNVNDDQVVDLDSIFGWISEHDTLTQDFENYFGISLGESLIRESAEKIQPGNIYSALVKELPAEDIDHHDSDLYVRKTPKSTEIINRLATKSLLSTFKDNIDGDIWYELPFCYTPYFGESKELSKQSLERGSVKTESKKLKEAGWTDDDMAIHFVVTRFPKKNEWGSTVTRKWKTMESAQKFADKEFPDDERIIIRQEEVYKKNPDLFSSSSPVLVRKEDKKWYTPKEAFKESKKLTESEDDFDELKQEWQEFLELGHNNVIEFEDGDYLYFDIDFDKHIMFAGSATNTGVLRQYEIYLDPSLNLDENIAELYDEIVWNKERDKTESFGGQKLGTLTNGHELFIDTSYGSGYQLCAEDGFGNYNPWTEMGPNNVLKVIEFDSPEDVVEFAKLHYGDKLILEDEFITESKKLTKSKKLTESQTQELEKIFKELDADYGIDVDAKLSEYTNGDYDLWVKTMFSEKGWKKFEKWLNKQGIFDKSTHFAISKAENWPLGTGDYWESGTERFTTVEDAKKFADKKFKSAAIVKIEDDRNHFSTASGESVRFKGTWMTENDFFKLRNSGKA